MPSYRLIRHIVKSIKIYYNSRTRIANNSIIELYLMTMLRSRGSADQLPFNSPTTIYNTIGMHLVIEVWVDNIGHNKAISYY